MKSIVVLLLGARRRVYFLNKFREELVKNGYKSKFLFADVDNLDPMASLCDGFVKLRSHTEASYIEDLKALIDTEKVNLIIPWNDSEIYTLNKNRNLIESNGAILVLPPSDHVEIFSDKLKTSEWSARNSIAHPKTFKLTSDVLEYLDSRYRPNDLILKPRFGQGSLGIIEPKSFNEILQVSNLKTPYIIQEKLQGEEYTIDLFAMQERAIMVSPRKRIKTRGGEALISQIVKDPCIEEFSSRISRKLENPGLINFQVFVNCGDVKLLEINPRFAGGSDLTIEAGGNIPELIIKRFIENTESYQAQPVRNKLTMSRYLKPVFF